MAFRRGFNLVETITASVILSGLVLAVVARTTQCLNYTGINRQYDAAAAVADKQLAMIDYVGIDEFVEAGSLSGEVTDYDLPFRWELETEYQEIDNVYLVTLTVSWIDRNRPRYMVVETMLDGKGTYTESEEQAAGPGGGPGGEGGGQQGGGR